MVVITNEDVGKPAEAITLGNPDGGMGYFCANEEEEKMDGCSIYC